MSHPNHCCSRICHSGDTCLRNNGSIQTLFNLIQKCRYLFHRCMFVQFEKDKGIYIDLPVQTFQIAPGVSQIFNYKQLDVIYPVCDSFRNGIGRIRISQGIWDQVEDSFHDLYKE